MTRKKWTLIANIFTGLFLIIAYLPALSAPLFSTDDQSLLMIPQFQPPITFETIRTLFKVGAHIDYYPIRDLSYLIDKVMWPKSWAAARLHQILLFWLTSVVSIFIL